MNCLNYIYLLTFKNYAYAKNESFLEIVDAGIGISNGCGV